VDSTYTSGTTKTIRSLITLYLIDPCTFNNLTITGTSSSMVDMVYYIASYPANLVIDYVTVGNYPYCDYEFALLTTNYAFMTFTPSTGALDIATSDPNLAGNYSVSIRVRIKNDTTIK
jgi:hypothetical protein